MKFNFEKRGGGDTGRIFEARVLGEYKITPEFLEREKNLPRNRRGRYEKDDDIYNLITEQYTDTGDPEDPPTQIGKDIRIAVSEALGLNPEEEKKLKFYTAVKTPVDYKMGVDAFVEFEDPKSGRITRVTIDVTLNKRKVEEQGAKADVVIGELPDAVQEEDEYLDAIDGYGHQIAVRLMGEQNRKAA